MRRAFAPTVAALATAALLSGAAVYTVQRAGCEDPGHYVTNGQSVELVGGCLEPGDLPVGPSPAELDSNADGDPVRP